MNIKKYSFTEFSRDSAINQQVLSEAEFEKRIKVFNEIFTGNPSDDEIQVDEQPQQNYEVQDFQSETKDNAPETIGAAIDIVSILEKKKEEEKPFVAAKTYEEGLRDGYENARKELNQLQIDLTNEQNTVINMLMQKLNYLGGELVEKVSKDLALEMTELTVEVASKIAASVLKKDYIEIIREEIENVLSKLITSQNVTVELNPQTSIKMRPLLMSEYDNQSFKMEIVDNNDLEVYDCKVSWIDGAFEFVKKNREQIIKDILKQFVSRAKK
ncbi:MAG: hypothetical protein J0G32_07165 [Alphaproteobacteria bacterium]|nr:hypothetical protein [Alphaproteobacteria bacterium]OJV13594.1 MAG: hypothetical protein BGO27_03155 [Alphaproteobacteria bacterium 33-17]